MSENAIEKPRWRAKRCGRYFHITSFLEVRPERDYQTMTDNMYYEIGNYFKKAREAEEAAKKIRLILNLYRNGRKEM